MCIEQHIVNSEIALRPLLPCSDAHLSRRAFQTLREWSYDNDSAQLRPTMCANMLWLQGSAQ